MNSFQKLSLLTNLCKKIEKNPSELDLLKEFNEIIAESSKSFVQAAQKIILTTCYIYLQNISNNKLKLKSLEKELLLDTLNGVLNKLIVEHRNVFFNFYTFFLLELDDIKIQPIIHHEIRPAVSEELKIASLNCIISLMKCVSEDILEEIYDKENIPKFSLIIFICCEIAKKEPARNLRILAINCILTVARVSANFEYDLVFRNICANTFMIFLPGLIATFTEIALEDVKIGHQVPMLAIQAYGKLIELVMYDYNASDKKINIKNTDNKEIIIINESPHRHINNRVRFINKKEIDEYLKNNQRTVQWYQLTDEKLNICFKKLAVLTYHSHFKVRYELAQMAFNLFKNCSNTMPKSICTLLEFLIILSEDDQNDVRKLTNSALEFLSTKLIEDDKLKCAFENLEDGFYNAINSLPRKFNSIDDNEKVNALNLLIGYVKLFGVLNLNNVLINGNILKSLVQGLLHITELDNSGISLLEEYSLKDLNTESSLKRAWINFHYFQADSVTNKLDILCKNLAANCFEILQDSLMETILYEKNRKKEAIYLINSLIAGLENFPVGNNNNESTLKNILNNYNEDLLHDLKSALNSEEFSPEEIQTNVIIICLITEGISEISKGFQKAFQPFLLKILYSILEKAGSDHPLIRIAGLVALRNLTISCEYKDVADLISGNFDFIFYHVQRKLIKAEDKEGVLNVLSLVLQYSQKDMLHPMKNIIEDILFVSCDRYKARYATYYLKVFKMFIQSLERWYNIVEIKQEENADGVKKARKEKEIEEYEDFKVSNNIMMNEDFSDNVMEGKSAEEMFKEDMEKKENDEALMMETNNEIREKPRPPMHVEITAHILKKSLNFLPSKDSNRKLLVLEILQNGLEIIREWDDELLPLVHQIWNPLLQRFNQENDFLIQRYSVKLLNTLCRLSKSFIKSRLIKELLPKLKDILTKLAEMSYLKDRGASYRYSQSYKLQIEILSSIGTILYNIDADSEIIFDMAKCIENYLSDKQPQELQIEALKVYKIFSQFDKETLENWLENLENSDNEELRKNLVHLKAL